MTLNVVDLSCVECYESRRQKYPRLYLLVGSTIADGLPCNCRSRCEIAMQVVNPIAVRMFKITQIRVSTFWMPGRSTHSRQRPMADHSDFRLAILICHSSLSSWGLWIAMYFCATIWVKLSLGSGTASGLGCINALLEQSTRCRQIFLRCGCDAAAIWLRCKA